MGGQKTANATVDFFFLVVFVQSHSLQHGGFSAAAGLPGELSQS